MTQQIINIGATPNDGNGDPLRVAFGKINNNFSELYNLSTGQASPPDGAVQFRSTYNFDTIGYGSNTWIVFGYPNRYYRSLDGITFSKENSPVTLPNTINQVIYANNRFIAVGNNGTIITSDDLGVTWDVRTSGTTENLRQVHFEQTRNQYLVIGDNGKILASTNLSTWVDSPSGVTSNLKSITYNSLVSTYVVVGDSGTVLVSNDGTGWSTPQSGITTSLNSVSNNGVNFVAVGDNGVILTSVNGVIWVNNTLSSGTTQNLNSITWGTLGTTGVFVVVGANGTALTNTDGTGTTWTSTNTGFTYELNSVVWGEYVELSRSYKFFYSAGNNGTIIETTDLSGWINRSVNASFDGTANFVYNKDLDTLFVGNVDANSGSLIGNVVISNIVNTGTMSVSGETILGEVGNVKILGGNDGYVLTTDGTGNLRWTASSVVTANINFVKTANTPNTFVQSTAAVTDTITLSDASQFYLNMPVAFTGLVFGGITANSTYFINNVIGNNQITISTTRGGPNVSLGTASGNCFITLVDTEVTTSTQNLFPRGVQVTITDVIGMTQLNGKSYYADVRTSNKFGLFLDESMTIPVNSITYNAYEGYGRALAAIGGGGNGGGVSKIVAGNNITISPEEGTGVVTISSTGGGGNANVVSIPAIYFTATVDGNNQSFSNSLLSSYESADDLTVFLNGSLLENGFYTLSGSTLTVTTEIQTGDSIDIIRQFAANVISGNSTPGGNNTELQYNNNGSFGGVTTVTYDGANISLGDISNVKISGGNSGQIIATDGNGTLYWANGGTADYSNANVKSYLESGFDGNILPSENLVYSLGSAEKQWKDIHVGGNTIFLSNIPLSVTSNGNLAFDGTELAFTGPNNNQDVQTSGNIIANVFIGNSITLSGTITANTANFVTLDTTSANLGTVENVTILGGEQNQVLSTDGSGNLQWIDRLSGIGPSGPVNSVQFNAGFGNFGGSSFLTYDSANTTLNVSGNLLANSISIGTGVYSFNRTFVYSAVTNSTLPDQEIYAVNAETTSGMDFMIISTDESSKSRQTTRFSVIHYSGNISYTETATMTINNYLGNWNISYDPGSVIRDPQIVLTFSPETSNVIYHRMMITTYEP